MQREVAPRLLAFWQHFQDAGGAARTALSIRDLLAWAHFVTTAAPAVGLLPAYAHGAHLVLLDGIGLGLGMPHEVRKLVEQSLSVVAAGLAASALPAYIGSGPDAAQPLAGLDMPYEACNKLIVMRDSVSLM